MEKKITLSIIDRLLLRPMLQVEGGRIEMIVVNGINSLIEFTSEEVTEFELKDLPGTGVSYNPQKAVEKQYELTDEQIKILKSIPERLDIEKKVTIAMFPLLDKIDQL